MDRVEGGATLRMSSTLLIALVIAGMGGVVAGLTGFGFGLFTVPLLLLLYPPATVTAMGSAAALASGWIVLLGTWRTVQVRTVGALIPGATIGVFLGTVLLRALDPAIIKLTAGAVVFLFAISLLRGWRIDAVHHPLAAPLAGLASGTLSTSAGMSGPPVVLLFTTRQYDMQQFRGSVTAYFYYVNAIGLTLLILRGIVGRRRAACRRPLATGRNPGAVRRQVAGALGFASAIPNDHAGHAADDGHDWYRGRLAGIRRLAGWSSTARCCWR